MQIVLIKKYPNKMKMVNQKMYASIGLFELIYKEMTIVEAKAINRKTSYAQRISVNTWLMIARIIMKSADSR